MGCVYRRNKKYWVKYYRNGKQFAESSKSDKRAVAERLLKMREGEIAQGKLPGIYFDRVQYDELEADFLADYKLNEKKSLERAERSLKHLRIGFKGQRVPQISTDQIMIYIEKRKGEGAKNATINRELSALKRMLNLGAKQTPPKVDRVPFIPMLRENNVRKGFFEHGEFLKFRENLPSHLRGFVTFAYKTGWRRSEIANLTWSNVDLKHGLVRLNAGETKNDEGRVVFLDEETKKILNDAWQSRKRTKKLTPFVFVNKDCTDKIRRFDKSWKTVCKTVKIEGRLFHDLRRTAIRNMVRAGVPERVVMMVSGHKTRAVFERYNIVSEADLQLAAERQEAYLKAQNSYNLVTMAEKGHQTKKGYQV